MDANLETYVNMIAAELPAAIKKTGEQLGLTKDRNLFNKLEERLAQLKKFRQQLKTVKTGSKEHKDAGKMFSEELEQKVRNTLTNIQLLLGPPAPRAIIPPRAPSPTRGPGPSPGPGRGPGPGPGQPFGEGKPKKCRKCGLPKY